MVAELTFWLAVLVLGVLPGLLVLKTAKVRWPKSEALAAVPGLSVGIVSLCAYLAEFLTLPITLLPMSRSASAV